MHSEPSHQFPSEFDMMRHSVDRASDSIFWVGPAGNILYANDAACTERGYTREEMLSLTIFDLDPDYQPEIWQQHFAKLKHVGKFSLETRHFDKSGREYPVEVSANYVQIGDREFNFCFVRDISERKQVEAATLGASNLLKKIASRIPGVIYQFRLYPDGSACFPFASDAIRDIYRVTPEEVREDASKVFAILHPDDLDRITQSIRQSAFDMSLWRQEYRVQYEDGTVRWLLGNAMPELEANGSVLWHGYITDVTPQKQTQALLIKTNSELEERVSRRTSDLANSNRSLKKAHDDLMRAQSELIQREKMSALGVLIAGVSHEMNTPLGNSLMASSSLLDRIEQFKNQLSQGAVTKKMVQDYNDFMSGGLDLLARNLSRAIEQLIHFKQVSVDQASEQRRCFDLKSIVADNISILLPRFKRTPHKIVCDIADGIELDSYPGSLGQVITNLVLNALIHGFTAEISGVVSVSAEIVEHGVVKLVVSDNGKGISPINLGRVFDPFFTTKMGQGGSGLGLNIVFNIVKSTLGGRIEVASEEGRYTAFTMYIPTVAPEPASP